MMWWRGTTTEVISVVLITGVTADRHGIRLERFLRVLDRLDLLGKLNAYEAFE